MTELNTDELTFETAVAQLNDTVNQLEEGDLTLEKSLDLYERGRQLATFCRRYLADATLRVEQLTADGEIVDRPPEEE